MDNTKKINIFTCIILSILSILILIQVKENANNIPTSNDVIYESNIQSKIIYYPLVMGNNKGGDYRLIVKNNYVKMTNFIEVKTPDVIGEVIIENSDTQETVYETIIDQGVIDEEWEAIELGLEEPEEVEDVYSNSKQSHKGIRVGDVIKGHLTHYCAGACCNGKKNAGKTASGFKIKNGMKNPYIVACNWLPLNSIIEVNGVKYTVKDRGGRGLNPVGRLDIFTPEGHKAANKLGRIRNGISIKVVFIA